MKSSKIIVLFLIAAVVSGGFNTSYAKAANKYDTAYKDRIFNMVVPTYTMATVKEDCLLRAEPNVFSAKRCELRKGSVVEVLQDSSEKWYKVESVDEDDVGWLAAKYLDIHEEKAPGLAEMSEDELETFVNIMDFPTKSGYLIWTDIARQRTYVFKKAGSYSLIKTFLCSTGRSVTPTTRGFFTINGRGKWFYSKRFQSGAKYWVRFNETYLFHSVAMDKNKCIVDGVLGERRSSGCVRHSVLDAEWIYMNIPDGTSVFIH